MPVPSPAPVLLGEFVRRGFTLRVVAGGLSVAPAAALTLDDRAAIRARRDELLALLSVPDGRPTDGPATRPGEPWNVRVALKLMADADGLVERLGVDGRHPVIVDAAALVVSAYQTHDLETVRFAVTEFVVAVRERARRAAERTSAEVSPHAGFPSAVSPSGGDTRP